MDGNNCFIYLIANPLPRENLSLKAELLLTDWVAVISLATGFENDFFACMYTHHGCMQRSVSAFE